MNDDALDRAVATSYERISRPFDTIFRDVRGGVSFDYATGEQVITRLNEDVGLGRWSFEIVMHGIHVEADECWVQGSLTALIIDEDGRERKVVKQQFGSQKIKRSRSSGTPLDIGFDLKGATTDALKKCASQLGVGLYLWRKEGGLSRLDDGIPEGAEFIPGGTGQKVARPIPRQEPKAPINLVATPEQHQTYVDLLSEATAAGFKAGWVTDDPERMTGPQLTGYTKLLRQYLDKRESVLA